MELNFLNLIEIIAPIGLLIGWFVKRLDKKFDKIDERFDKIDERFDKIDERFDKIDERFDKIDERFDKIETILQNHGERIARMEGILGSGCHFKENDKIIKKAE